MADIDTSYLDEDTDSIKAARPALLSVVQRVNQLASSSGASLVNYLQGGTSSVLVSAQDKFREYLSIKDFGAIGDGITDSTANIQAAINAASVLGVSVYLPAGTYLINGVLTAGTLAVLYGAGADKTILKKGGTSGHILDILGTSNKYDIEIKDITFDVNSIDSGIVSEYVTNFSVRRCKFKNMKLWGIHVGVQLGTDSSIRNSRIVIEDCVFENGQQTYEHILVFNSQDVSIVGCSFKTGANAYGIGLYQNLERVNIERCYFNINTGIYYSLSTNNIRISGCDFNQCNSGIKGANRPDNGTFGASFVANLRVDNCRFRNNTTGLQIGAVYNAIVSGCIFDLNLQQAIFINNGNSPVNNQSHNIAISDCQFQNNNYGAGASVLNPAILFSGIGGLMYANIVGCTFWDNQSTKTQLYPISFSGAFTWSQITIAFSRMSAFSGGTSIGLTGSAVLGSAVKILDCQDVSGTLPSGVILR